MSSLAATLLAAGLFWGSSRASAQNDLPAAGQTNGMAGAPTTLAMADQEFMTNAIQDGMLEVKLGELASQKAARDDLKSFGQKMVTDHSQINDDLKALAAKKGIHLPDILDAKHQKNYEGLAALAGTDFDNKYISAMVKGHKAAVRLFKKESATQDTDIKSFVDKSLTVIQEHLNMIEGMSKS